MEFNSLLPKEGQGMAGPNRTESQCALSRAHLANVSECTLDQKVIYDRKLDACGQRQIAFGRDTDLLELFVQIEPALTAEQRTTLAALLERPNYLERAVTGMSSVAQLKRLVCLPFVRSIDVSTLI